MKILRGKMTLLCFIATTFYIFILQINVQAAVSSKVANEEQADSNWKNELPFIYDENYTKVQNLFIHIVSNEGAVDDVEECAAIMDLKYTTKQFYSEETMDYLKDLWGVRIYDDGEIITYELHKYNGVLRQSLLQYEPKSSFGLVVKPTMYFDSYLVEDKEYPMNVYLRGATGFATLQDALDFIVEYNSR